MRISNLARLHLKEHLVRPGGSRSLRMIDIPPEQVKNEVRLLYELSQRVTGLVDRFVRDCRPRLAKPDNFYLFPGRSTHKTPNWLSRQIRDVIAHWVGIDMTPHQFRHLAGLLMQKKSPAVSPPWRSYSDTSASTRSSAITRNSIRCRQVANSTQSWRVNLRKRICHVGDANDSASTWSPGH